MESSNARDRRVPGRSRSKASKGKRRQDSNHTHSSTDLPGGGKLVAGLGAAITRHRLILLGVGLLIGALHSQHLYHLFENDRFFTHLSPLERELSFRTEMGLYYSYYKTIVEAPSLVSGVHLLLHDNTTEYPHTINTLKRFNLYPEVILGASYRWFASFLRSIEVTGKTCYTIERGYGQPPVDTCSGIGEPVYFYVLCVFAVNALLPAGLFLSSTYLSDSILGGAVSVVMFFYNHGEATRVMWTPPLRESYSMPLLPLQMFCITHILREKRPAMVWYIILVTLSVSFMLPWQFAQFTLLTQVAGLFAVYTIRLLPRDKFVRIVLSLLSALVVNIVLQLGNVLLLSSYFAAALVVSLVVTLVRPIFNYFRLLLLSATCEMMLWITCTVMLKMMIAKWIGADDDGHIGALLLSKFTSYEDFHTQLYTCAPEFDYLSLSYAGKLNLTLLIPVGLVAALLVVYQVLHYLTTNLWIVSTTTVAAAATHSSTTEGRNHTNSNNSSTSTASTNKVHENEHLPEMCYHVVQTMLFAVMAILIMRLKLFLTPQLTIVAGLICSKKVVWMLSWHQRKWIVGVVMVLASVTGLWNLSNQISISGEFNHPEMEELMLWINSSTPAGASFAGSMPTMATVKLATGRPIINHPHYEDLSIRQKTKLIYTIYSRRSPATVHSILSNLKADYVIVEDAWCRRQYRPGCAFHEVYLKEFPEDKGNPLFCEEISSNISHPFKLEFKNKHYRVLKV